MKASISRTLVIKSPLELFKIINKFDEIESNELSYDFKEIVRNYLNGCGCITDINYSLMMDEYSDLSNNLEFINLIKESIDCDGIIFKNDL